MLFCGYRPLLAGNGIQSLHGWCRLANNNKNKGVKEDVVTSEKELQEQIAKTVKKKMTSLFARYDRNLGDLEAILKWKPMVLIIGNYSSGKSTLINELVGREVQRTGQAPTDDSFTVITAVDPGEPEREVPGATLVNDQTLPFALFKGYGEQLVSHLRMKKIDSSVLEDFAVIDTPGMLDSVTEKDRGYDYMGILGEFAKLSDLVVLMFDPHKAGTIKETYTTIRNTLPETSGEDRIVFVMSRIDECDNSADLVHSYGTLCWNLSQMTGRKDIPRIFLTFAPNVSRDLEGLEAWALERKELIAKIMAAPNLRLSHILQDVDKQVNELRMVVEAMVSFSQEGRTLLANTVKYALVVGFVNFFFLDAVVRELAGFPQEIFLQTLVAGTVSTNNLIIPVAGVALWLGLGLLWFLKWSFARLIERCQADPERLIALESVYREHAWSKIKNTVITLLGRAGLRDLLPAHGLNLGKIQKFLREDLQEYYAKIR